MNMSSVSRAISHFFHRFHVLVFTVFVLGGLAVATMLLYQTVQSTNQITPDATVQPFDQETIDKIKQYKTSDENTGELKLPAGRTNPFE